jgi:hypothetical protein
MIKSSSFTTTSLLGSTTAILGDAGYKEIDVSSDSFWESSNTRLFEDEHGIVSIVVYETWKDLADGWQTAQEQLVVLMSSHMSSGEPKFWDGYLVLLTRSPLASESELDRIRYDVTRLRKIVATGEELLSRSDLERVLSPLLPLEGYLLSSDEDTILSRLPKILAKRDIPEEFTEVIVAAFLDQEPLIEKLDASRREK